MTRGGTAGEADAAIVGAVGLSGRSGPRNLLDMEVPVDAQDALPDGVVCLSAASLGARNARAVPHTI